MARLEQESLSKKSNKFDNFLKKNLDEQTFHRIRGYEACIVCSEKESKAFKFVVLSDEYIYFTENPPKSITRAARLADVLSIELLDALPEFLSGQEQLNTQHIAVTYLSSAPAASSRDSERGSRPAAAAASGTAAALPEADPASSSSDYDDDDGGAGGGDGEAAATAAAAGDVASSPNGPSNRAAGAAGLTQSMPAQALKSLLKASRDEGRTTPKKTVTIYAEDSRRDVESSSSSPSSTLGRRRTSRSEESLEKSDRSPSGGAAAAAHAEKSASDGFARRSTTGASMRAAPPEERTVESANASGSGGRADSRGSNVGGLPQLRQLVMHIYMLRSTSTMFSLMQSAASNCIIRTTLTLDPNYRQRIALSPRSSATIDKVEAQFGCLASELMDPENTLEQTFGLMQELKTAAEKDFYLKKLFWRSPDLFAFIVRLLQTYLPRSPVPGNDATTSRARRADEFELMILTTQTLELMFRETEILPSRLRVLRFGGGRLAADLIAALTCFPDLPTPYVPNVRQASGAAVRSEAASWQCLGDLELHELLTEFTNAASAVLFEMILIAEQANWGDAASSFFNVSWIMRVMEDINATEKFLERLVGQAMRMVQPSRHVELPPHAAVLLFQQFTVLHTVVRCSPPLAAFIRNSYTEEFKYYIRAAVLAEKLPLEYPITRRTTLLIQEVISVVLQKKKSSPLPGAPSLG